MVSDVSRAQDNTLCIVNFLPSVDDFWVLGNPIFKDYYVYHNPEQGVMGWVPTKDKFKQPLWMEDVPTKSIEFVYDWEVTGIKAGLALMLWIGTWAMATFVFTKTFSGVSFLNESSRKTTRSELVKKLDLLSADRLTEMLQTVRAKQASNLLK